MEVAVATTLNGPLRGRARQAASPRHAVSRAGSAAGQGNPFGAAEQSAGLDRRWRRARMQCVGSGGMRLDVPPGESPASENFIVLRGR